MSKSLKTKSNKKIQKEKDITSSDSVDSSDYNPNNIKINKFFMI